MEVKKKHDSHALIYAEIDNQKVLLKNGKGLITIKNPKLWWARGYGDPFLYNLTVTLVDNGKVIDQNVKKIGLRTLSISREQDADGKEFCFILNGIKIFAMGANYIPQDSIFPRITKDTVQRLLNTAIDANFNCIRVWGGGYYPKDDFFDFCDEHGILVWQDFMSACINVWLREEFEKEFVAEAIENVKRIRHHASLALLCGNNEMEQTVRDSEVGESTLVRMDYIRLYEQLLPDIVEKNAPQTFYWPSSPSSGGGFVNPSSPSDGDIHYWDVWHGGVPFTEYRKYRFRFCSEYGFESFPSMKTIASFCPEKDRNAFSRVMESHQKCPNGNQKILSYLSSTYLYPNKFEDLVYASQLLQADAIKYGVEHFRRIRGCCMGSIYWQFNDCWPVASWSSVDYFGRCKALHYAAKKFYAPTTMSLLYEKNTVVVNISNEQREDFDGHIEVYLCRSDLSVINSQNADLHVSELKSEDVLMFHVDPEDIYSNYCYADLYNENGDFIMRQTYLFVEPKHFKWIAPDIQISASSHDGKIILSFKTNVFAKGVFVDFQEFDANLSDNFFDLTCQTPYEITLNTDHSIKDLLQNIKIKSVYDIGS